MSTQVETGKTRNCVETRCPQDRVFFFKFFQFPPYINKIPKNKPHFEQNTTDCESMFLS